MRSWLLVVLNTIVCNDVLFENALSGIEYIVYAGMVTSFTVDKSEMFVKIWNDILSPLVELNTNELDCIGGDE
jgi:hypothetical protein